MPFRAIKRSVQITATTIKQNKSPQTHSQALITHKRKDKLELTSSELGGRKHIIKSPHPPAPFKWRTYWFLQRYRCWMKPELISLIHAWPRLTFSAYFNVAVVVFVHWKAPQCSATAADDVVMAPLQRKTPQEFWRNRVPFFYGWRSQSWQLLTQCQEPSQDWQREMELTWGDLESCEQFGSVCVCVFLSGLLFRKLQLVSRRDSDACWTFLLPPFLLKLLGHLD